MSFLSSLKATKTIMKAVPKSLTDREVNLVGNSTLEKLQNLYDQRRVGNFPAKASTTILPSQKRVIAICLVIVDCLIHEDIWKLWLEQSKDAHCQYSAMLFIQAKNPSAVQSEWVRNHLLPITFEPTWNSPEVIRAMVACMHAALDYRAEDGGCCERFIFATEYCIPIRSLKDTGSLLFAQDKSWLDARHEPTDNWERIHCFSAVKQDMIPQKAVWKSLPGWIMLTRRHAAEVNALVERFGGFDKSSEIDLITAFGPGGTWADHQEGVYAPEEIFFATMLSLLGYLRDTSDEVLRKRVVFADWERRGTPHPISYSSLNESLLREMQSKDCCLARKFPRGSIEVDAWLALVMGVHKTSSTVSPVDTTTPEKDSEVDNEPKIKRQRFLEEKGSLAI